MPLKALTYKQIKKIECAWISFEAVLQTLPASGTAELLVFHSRSLLDRLSEPPVDFEHIRIITKRVNELAKLSRAELGIESALDAVNSALVTAMDSSN